MRVLKKYILVIIAVAFLLSIAGYIVFNFMKGDTTREKPPISPLSLNINTFFNDSLLQNAKVKEYFTQIYHLQKGTLTDQEEGELIALIKQSKADSTLNQLLQKLGQSGLLKNIIYRWEEEAFAFDDPTLVDKVISQFTGKTFPVKPINIYYYNVLFYDIFTCPYLNYNSGKVVFDALCYRYGEPEFKNPQTTNGGLQSNITSLIAREGTYYLSEDTKTLFREAMQFLRGTAAQQKVMEVAKKTLEIKMN